jgi:methyl-accepting chemotaxis protein
MKTVHVKTRIRMAIGTIGVGYVALLLVMQWTGTHTQRAIQTAAGSLFPATLSSQEAEAAFQKLTKSYSDAVVLQDASALARADEAAAAVRAALHASEEALAADPARHDEVVELEGRFASLTERSRSVYATMASGGATVSPDMQSQMAGLAQENKSMEAALAQLQTDLSGDFRAQLESVTAWTNRQRLFGISLFLVVAVCAGLLTLMVERRVSAPLQALTESLRDIAEGEGDLTRRIPITSEDEIGELSRWFNTFVEKLQGIIGQVQENTARLTGACEGISGSSAEMAKGAEAQQLQTAQAATAMHEMSSTVQEVSRNSNAAADRAHSGAGEAREGGEAMRKTIAMLQTVTASVEQAAKQVGELGSRSDQIGRIVGVINEIAEQTNLLALNAAIEAARAGEHGRGFAVVAGEVRRLAERTTAATREIAPMIANIQQETRAAVEAMVQGTAEMQQGVNAAEETGERLTKIIEGAEEAARAVAQIATAATEQATTTDEVNLSINEIARISRDFASGAQRSAEASGSLSGLAAELEVLVSRFRVEDGVKRASHTIGRSREAAARRESPARMVSQPGLSA